jgi:4-amino-4-deoxy-L-arabinose transferase-like glycosyltransferase
MPPKHRPGFDPSVHGPGGARLTSAPAQAGVAAVLTALLYLPGLAVSPPHLLHDEIKFALQSKSIADTGRDLNGRMFAVYFPEPGFSGGRDPVCIYVTAGVLAVLPLTDTSIRVPSALVGALGVGLVFLLAHRVFGRASTAWMVALLLALTPTYFIHSRLALSVIYPVPFVLIWLLVLQWHLSAPRRLTAALCGLVLGLGVYSYLGSVLMMPLYLAVTCGVMALRREWRHAALAAAVFAAALIPVALWQLAQPDRYTDLIASYRLFEQKPGPAPGLLDTIGPALRERLDVYWDTFNPSRLFFTGESSLHISTRAVGSFLLPVAVLLIAGIAAIVRERRTPIGAVLLIGLLTAPLPAVIMADVEIRRWLVVTPFAAMIAGFGIERLRGGRPVARAACAGLLLLAIVQFAFFARDYFGPYRERASFWFGGNIRAALQTTLDDVGERTAAVYINEDIPWVEAYWRFYATARGQARLIPHARYVRFDTTAPPAASADALAVVPAQNQAAIDALARAGWAVRHRVPDLDGKPSFVIFGSSGL